MLKPRPAIVNVPAYHPPLAGRNGLRLDFNENTAGCSPRVLARLQQLTADDLARYPEREPVEAQVAELLGIGAAQLLLTNGVDEAIHLLCQAYLEPGDEAFIVVPTYSMYRIYMMSAGATVIALPTRPHFEFPATELQNRITPKTRLVAIANPNNPTGAVVSAAQLLSIIRSAPHAAILIDEAYFEFYGQTLLQHCCEFPNLFIARTFSKAHGLAGLRAGILAGHPDQMRFVRLAASPYNLNAVALACLSEALADRCYIDQYVAEVRDSRELLQQFFAANGIQFWPSHANFVLARVGATKETAAAFVDQMRQQGILVRDRSADHACEGCVRITLGPRKHFDKLLPALQQVLANQSLTQGASR